MFVSEMANCEEKFGRKQK